MAEGQESVRAAREPIQEALRESGEAKRALAHAREHIALGQLGSRVSDLVVRLERLKALSLDRGQERMLTLERQGGVHKESILQLDEAVAIQEGVVRAHSQRLDELDSRLGGVVEQAGRLLDDHLLHKRRIEMLESRHQIPDDAAHVETEDAVEDVQGAWVEVAHRLRRIADEVEAIQRLI